jgi:hypothetical protein
MDLNFTAEEFAFRDEVRAFLRDQAAGRDQPQGASAASA